MCYYHFVLVLPSWENQPNEDSALVDESESEPEPEIGLNSRYPISQRPCALQERR